MFESYNLSEMFIAFRARYTQLSSESQIPSKHLEVCQSIVGWHVTEKLLALEERD